MSRITHIITHMPHLTHHTNTHSHHHTHTHAYKCMNTDATAEAKTQSSPCPDVITSGTATSFPVSSHCWYLSGWLFLSTFHVIYSLSMYIHKNPTPHPSHAHTQHTALWAVVPFGSLLSPDSSYARVAWAGIFLWLFNIAQLQRIA